MVKCMRQALQTLPLSRVDLSLVEHRFGSVKKISGIQLLLRIVDSEDPVAVSEGGDMLAALQYGNHSVHQFLPKS